MEIPRCCINDKDLNNLKSLPTTFYEYVIKLRPVSPPKMAHHQAIPVQENE